MIDWNRVSQLREEIGAEDFGEVVELFLEEVEMEITKMRCGKSAERLESQLHFLKGSALNLGFTDFSTRCQKGETAAANGQLNQIDLAGVLESYETSKAQFLEVLNRVTAT